MMMLAAALFLQMGDPQEPALHTEKIEYKHGDVVLEGYLAYDPKVKGKRPGIVVVHEWKGRGEYVERRARQLAELGYTAFAIDMYGKGVFAKDHEEAGKLAGVYFKDRKLMRERATAGLEVLRKHETVDPSKLAAMGYCFGGTTALEMARAGLPLKGVVSFHGNLSTPHPEDAKNIKGMVMVCHGAEDTFIPKEVVEAFMEEMKKAGVALNFHTYAGAVHSFTVKEAGDDPSKGMAYNEKADLDSWEKTTKFFKGIFE